MAYARDNIERLCAYVPGEQPRVEGLIKLNTNENPYPPSPRVLAALREAVDGRVRLYPDPTATGVRQRLGQRYGFDPAEILVGNGCDDILNLCVRAFCGEGDRLAYLWPSYSLYPVLAGIQGATAVEVPLDDRFQVPVDRAILDQVATARLLFITQPNAPSGVLLPPRDVQQLVGACRGVVVIDEAYADFAEMDCLELARRGPNVLVARTLSKSFSFAGLRVGWAAGPRELIGALDKVRDSYNVNRLSQIGAEATLDDWDYYQANVRRVCATRDRVRAALVNLGFDVFPSQANFLFAGPPAPVTAREWFEELRQRKILVRWWDTPRVRDHARVTIGTDDEMNRFLAATREIVEPRT